MQTLSEIERAITRLPATEQRELARWLRERAADAWDAEIEDDVRAGRLDSIIAEVDEAISSGRVAEQP